MAEPPEAGRDAGEPATDTVGNEIVQRQPGGRHAAAEAGLTRAEHRMLQAVAEGRVAWVASGPSGFWRVDGAFAIGPKAMMLEWLESEGHLELAPRVRVVEAAVLTPSGAAALSRGD